MTTKKRLGQVLIDKGLVSPEQIEEALRIQVGGNRRIGYILTKMKLITSDQLQDVLSDQLDIPIIDIDQQFREDVKNILPRYLCRKYTVIPISMARNNVLNLAMMDPSDEDAIRDVEQFTGKVVRPLLANARKINVSIERHIPRSLSDFRNSPISFNFIKTAAGILILVLCLAGFFSYKYIQTEKYGTITRSGDVTTYKNHDLMVGVEKDSISLMGHAAYAQGFYKVSFNNAEDLKAFLTRKKESFSEKQYSWMHWVVDTAIKAQKGES